MDIKTISVLIIDDDEVAAEILQEYVLLNHPDARVEWCWNGYEALLKIEEFMPDVVFVDYMMPKLDGMEFITTLKKLGTCKSAYIAVISAYVDKERAEKFMGIGADIVLSKPVSLGQIGQIIRDAKNVT